MAWISIAVIRPSRRIPSLIRACTPGRALPNEVSSRRVTRIMTGLPIFLDSRIGICACGYPLILLPNPPPVNSLMSTTSDGSIPAYRAIGPTARAVL